MAKQRKGGNAVGDVYNGAATVGQFMAKVGMIICCIFGGLLIILGIFFCFLKNSRSGKVIGTVQSSSCTTSTAQPSTTTCSINIQYIVGGKTLTTTQTTVKTYNKGDQISLGYNPNNPSDVVIGNLSSWILGLIFIVFGLIIIGVGWLNYYLVNRFKFLAAFSGAENVVNVAF